jgi:hypothetical protein
MRSKGFIWLIVVLAMALVVVLFILLSNNGYSWYQSFEPNKEQPYDLKVLKKLLTKNAREADFEVLTKPYSIALEDLPNKAKHNLVVVLPYFFPDTAELFALHNFLKKGNTAFIATKEITPLLGLLFQHGKDSTSHLVEAINTDDVYRFVPDSVIQAYKDVAWDKADSIHERYQQALREKLFSENSAFDSVFSKGWVGAVHQSSDLRIKLARRVRQDTAISRWQSVKLDVLKEGSATAYFDTVGKPPLAVKWKVGKGSITICSTPIIFTNVYFIERQNFEFANAMLFDVNSGPILWDEVVRYNNELNYRGDGNSLGQSPLSFIMSQRSLQWAWFTLLGTVLLFVLFRSKRRQRIIPILKPNQNTTLAYAQLLGSLQLKEKNNTAKGNEIYQHFLHHLRNRYRWSTNLENDELKKRLRKIAPDLEREVQVVLHVGSIAGKEQALTDAQLINLFNYANLIIQRT